MQKLNMKIMSGTLGLLAIAACSSTPKNAVDVPITEMEKDYVLRDRNPNPAPDWMVDFSKYKREHDGKGTTYFSGASVDVSDRSGGCDLAELEAKKQIANQIATFISHDIASSKVGKILINKDNPNDPELRSHFEATLASKSMAFLSGVKVFSTYWEERDYSKSGGRKRVYNCDAVVTIDDLAFEKAIKRSVDRTTEMTDDPDSKSLVKEALKNVADEFRSFTTSKKN